MNDPHVVALLYTIEHGQSVDYRKARPLGHEEAGFRVKITNQQTRFEFKEHYATEDAARKAIEPTFLISASWAFFGSPRGEWEKPISPPTKEQVFFLIFPLKTASDPRVIPGVFAEI